jgi:hypothetical protein
MSKTLVTLVAAVAVGTFATASHAAPSFVFWEDFTGSDISGDWTITLGGNNATGWTYTVSDSKLNVTEIVDSTSGSGFATVTMQRTFSAMDEFQAVTLFDWASESSNGVMQWLRLGLYDNSSALVAEIAYKDNWADGTGCWQANIGGTITPGVKGDLALTGNAQTLSLTRDGADLITAKEGSNTLATGTLDTQVSELRITFETYRYYNPYFGEFNVDSVAMITPEPATIALLGLGASSLLMLRRRKRA